MNLRLVSLVLIRSISAVVAFSAFVLFLGLIGMQMFRWFRDGEWSRISISDGLLSIVSGCCARDDGAGTMVALARWLEAPQSWIGWHRVLEVMPASIGLFLISVLANFVYVYCSDRLDQQPRPLTDE
jgi:hypothetical protein